MQSSDRHQRLLLFRSRHRDSVDVFPFLPLEPLLDASHLCFDSDPSRGVTVRNTSLCLHLQHTTLTLLLVVGLADRGGQC